MKKAWHWLITKQSVRSSKILISGAIALLLTISCTDNASKYNRSSIEATPSSSPLRIYRRTQERQGTVYEGSPTESSKDDLPKLRIGVMPTQNQTDQEKILQALDKYLEEYLKRPVEFQIAQDNKEVVQLLVENQIQIAYLGSVTYLEAVDKGAKIQPLVAPIDTISGQPWYRMCIVVNANSNIQKLSDLKGKSIAFVDQTSNFGYLTALAEWKQERQENPYQDFTQVIYVGNHEQSMAALENNLVDAVATNLTACNNQQKDGKMPTKNIRIITETILTPNFPIVVSTELPDQVNHQLQQAFLSLPKGLDLIGGSQSDGYTLVVAAEYDQIQKIRQELNLISLPSK
ncbi:phosphonate ABC transporter substrate-binding protein [Nostoc sp. CENA543]|uniref:phosphate/phosphite/phosphonate ABC transporter substrate-binding protein n=1 Tax=Nostoc sp. CENA543 TaxID=1869241 RepID=UPI000CA1EF00|nr:phosphate/phosphite/phosphonate ABC transporter substrate-binding protein [Nostoc sp. CENA543]AUT03507.1 phosphonate ABC transporter substrate-binding protein [Nostoc sp. CENA543]